MSQQRKRIVRIVIVMVVILGVLLTMHFVVNSLDLPGALRSLHGG